MSSRRKRSRSQTPQRSRFESLVTSWLHLAVVALLVARPLAPSDANVESGSGLIFCLLWLLVLLTWGLLKLRQKQLAVRFHWIDGGLLGVIVWHTLSGVIAASGASPRPAINVCWEWISLGVMFFLVRQVAASAIACRGLLVVFVGLCAAQSLVGMNQHFFIQPQAVAEYEQIKHDREKVIDLFHRDYLPGSAAQMQLEHRLRNPGGATGVYALSNSLAGFLAPWLVIGIGITIAGWAAGEVNYRRLLLIGLLLAAMAVCLVLTESRTGIIAAAVGMLLLWPLLRKSCERKKTAIVAASIGLVGLTLIGVFLFASRYEAIASDAARSLGYRMEYWQATGRMILDNFWFGCGPGQFQATYMQYKLPAASEEVLDPHNFVLEVAATAGVPAMLLLLSAVGAYLYKTCAAVCNRASEQEGAGENVGAEKDRQASEQSARWMRYLWIGSMAGLAVAAVIDPSANTISRIENIFLAACSITLVLVLFREWIERGSLPLLLPVVGVAVVLLNLLAAGGIGFPSVATTLWLLLAIGLGGWSTRRYTFSLSGAGGIAFALAMSALVVLCYLLAYRPVSGSQRSLARAYQKEALKDSEIQETFVKRAVKADPFSYKAAKLYAALQFLRLESDMREAGPVKRRGTDQREQAALRDFSEAQTRYLNLRPNWSFAWAESASRYADLYQQTGEADFLKRSIADYRRATALYPAHAAIRVQLALQLLEAGDKSEAQEEAKRAIFLDDQQRKANHTDKWLPAEIRQQAERIAHDV